MIESTAIVTHTLELLQDGLERLHADRNVEVATALLHTMGSLTYEYGPEYFTDDEVALISDTTVVALATVVGHITQENCE